MPKPNQTSPETFKLLSSTMLGIDLNDQGTPNLPLERTSAYLHFQLEN
jgi:hypothetical protein